MTATKTHVGTIVSLGAAGLGATVAGTAGAQEATTGVSLGTITVSDEATGANNNDATVTTAGRSLSGSVRETPQTVNVVSQEILQQKHVTTLEEALKNVPGVTLSTGEGRGGLNGEQFRLRGLTAKGDIYTDGLRDFGSYTHDMFNTESVTVTKGPSGEAYGVGNLGGVINMQTKKAHLGDANEAGFTVSSGTSTRETVDLNKQLSETSAIRLNLMNQNGYEADRDHVSDNRQGVAVDYGTGIGTDTEWHIGYQYLKGKGKPDMGQPMGTDANGISRPLLEFDIPGYDRDTSYVRSTDRDNTEAHMLTSSFTHKVDDGFTISNNTRFAHYSRDFSATNPATCDATCIDGLRDGVDQLLSYGAGGGLSYRQDGWGFENLTSAQFEGDLFGARNKALVGLDFSYQKDRRMRGSWTGRDSDQTILDPKYGYPDATIAYDDTAKTNSEATNIGLIFADRMWFTNALSMQAGARADYFDSSFDGYMIASSEKSSGSSQTTRISPSVSLIWEPDNAKMAYLSLSRTYRPLGTDIASAAQSFASEVPSSDADYAPERADNVEIGGKIDVFDGALGLSAAVFQTEKKNSFTVAEDGTITTGFTDAGSATRVKGFEFGASGKIASDWTLAAAYAYLDGRVAGGRGMDAETIGNAAPGVAHHNLSLWTNYTVSPNLTHLPGDLSVGAGVTYASKYYTNADNTAVIPETVSLDMAIAYETETYRVALNGYNLTDHDNYESAFNASRAVPAAGRTFALTLSTKF